MSAFVSRNGMDIRQKVQNKGFICALIICFTGVFKGELLGKNNFCLVNLNIFDYDFDYF